MRSFLTDNLNLYVRADGNDANSGVQNTQECAFRQIQRAIEFVRDDLDLKKYNVTIYVGDGLYTPISIKAPWVGSGTVTILGNQTQPENCAILGNNHAVLASANARLVIKGFKLSTTTGSCIYVTDGAIVDFTAIDFGQTAITHVDTTDGGIARAILNGWYRISGGGVSHWHAHSGQIVAAYQTITIAAPVGFSAYFAGVANGRISCQRNTFVNPNNVTGKKHLIHYNGIVLTLAQSPENYLPGSLPGFADSSNGGYIC